MGRRVKVPSAVGVVLAGVLLAGCSGSHGGGGGSSANSSGPTIQSVASKIGCDKYEKDPADLQPEPGSIESGSCILLPSGAIARLYAMLSRDLGADLVHSYTKLGIPSKDITWYGNVLVVTDRNCLTGCD